MRAPSPRACPLRASPLALADDFTGLNTSGIADITDHGYQVQASAMAVPKVVQLYLGTSQIFGQHGDQWEVRGGENWYLDEGARDSPQR